MELSSSVFIFSLELQRAIKYINTVYENTMVLVKLLIKSVFFRYIPYSFII